MDGSKPEGVFVTSSRLTAQFKGILAGSPLARLFQVQRGSRVRRSILHVSGPKPRVEKQACGMGQVQRETRSGVLPQRSLQSLVISAEQIHGLFLNGMVMRCVAPLSACKGSEVT